MSKIQVLDTATVNKIAAGEVVERPASAVKEMVENAIDAKATKITVEIKNGGISFIRVTDNGQGIAPDDIEKAFLPHATSKIRGISDLETLYTMGFRGEALASIAAVSKVDVLTKTADSVLGTALSLEGGEILSKTEAGCPDGTTVAVKDLFFNTPARMHFMKKDSAEAAHVTEVVQRLALCYPAISFRLINNGRDVLFTPGTGDLKDAVSVVLGREIAAKTVKVDCEKDGVHVFGYAGLPEIARSNRTMQNFFVNGRWVKSKEMQFSAEAAYKTQLMTGKRPVLVLSVSVSPMLTDVNVHPQKMEIKFANEKLITSAVFLGVQNALFSAPKARGVSDMPESAVGEAPKEQKSVSFNVMHKKVEEKPKYEEKEFDFFSPESEELFSAPKAEADKAEDFFASLEEDENRYISASPAIEEADEHVEITEETPVRQSEASEAPEEISAEPEVLPFKVRGQVFDTYIIIEQNGEMLLMDQHAAHERLRYEEMVRDRRIYGQLLMLPEIIRLSAEDGEVLSENSEAFTNLGFSIEPFGAGEFAVRQLPDDITIDDVENTIVEILELIKQNKNPEDFMDSAFFMIACKGAVKANHALSEKEMTALVKAVLENDRIRTCPHGRPLLLSFSKKWIEKEFKRIV